MSMKEVPAGVGAAIPVTAVDSHAHVFSSTLPLARQRRYAPSYDAPLERYLGELDRRGISHGVLVQPSFLGTDNSYLLRALAAAPQRLRGVAVIDPLAAAADPRSLDALAAAGVVGIRLNLIGMPDADFTSAPWRTVLPRIAGLGWHIEVHCEARRLMDIAKPLLARDGSDALTLVVDHFGRPDPALGVEDPGFRQLLALGQTGRVWVKVSAAYRNGGTSVDPSGQRTAHAALPCLREAFGLERLVWGSDWPHTQFESRQTFGDTWDLLHALIPDEGQRQIVLAEAPARLFGFR